MIATLLGIFIPLGYIAVASFTFYLVFFTLKNQRALRRKRGDWVSSLEDDAFPATFAAVFWPVGLPFFVAYSRAVGRLSSDGMSRKQRAEITYLREKAELDAKALETQRQWEQLLAKEQRP